MMHLFLGCHHQKTVLTGDADSVEEKRSVNQSLNKLPLVCHKEGCEGKMFYVDLQLSKTKLLEVVALKLICVKCGASEAILPVEPIPLKTDKPRKHKSWGV